MYELHPLEYDRVRPLFQAMDFHLAVNGILEGTTPGRICVDHASQPQAALAWTGHRFYLAGSGRNSGTGDGLRRFFAETVVPHALQAGGATFMLYYTPDHWKAKIDGILRDNFSIWGLREFYALKELKHNWRSLLPEGYLLRSVDKSLLAEGHLTNLELLTEEMCSERASVEDFLEKSFGVCLLHGDEIVGWCLSEYNSPGRCEVGIATLEPYRCRGLATLTAAALVEQALSRGISQVGWHCWANNVPSVATALKVGFAKVREYPVFFVRYDEHRAARESVRRG